MLSRVWGADATSRPVPWVDEAPPEVRLPTTFAVLGRVLQNPEMRRALGGWVLGWGSEWAWLVALAVYAFNAGGLAVVGLVGLARTLPAALLAPALGSLADRLPRARVLLAINTGRAVLVGIAALVALVHWSPLLVYGLATVDAMLAVLHRPTYMSLLPSLARSPEDLVGGNVASSAVEAVGILSGPAVGAVLVASGIVPLTFAVPAITFMAAAVSVAGLHPDAPIIGPADATAGRASVLTGLRALRRHRHAALIVGLMGTQTMVRGALSVLIVAGAIELLAMNDQGVGYLNAAIGAGGLVGALAATAVIGNRRMAPSLFLGLVLWGVPILVTGVVPVAVVALVAMAAVGAGNAIEDVSGYTLLQRILPNGVRGSVLGVLEAATMLGVGVGAALAPVLVLSVTLRGAWVVTGALLPLLAVLSWRQMRTADEQAVIPERELTLLRDVPMLRVLPLTVLEQVANDLQPMTFKSGDPIIRQGSVGDRFYVIASGQVEVQVDGRPVRRQGPGESFGEVALLRDVPRTAAVVAASDVEVFAVGRLPFICAVTGDRRSLQAADAVIEDRLGAKPESELDRI